MKNNEFDLLVDELTKELAETLKRKNRDYGDSFAKQYAKYGMASSMIRIEDKISRLETLVKNNEKTNVQDESLDDTLLDLCGYSLLTLIERKRG
jgi:hypothetical protein